MSFPNRNNLLTSLDAKAQICGGFFWLLCLGFIVQCSGDGLAENGVRT
jgi:hypothetical protein